MVNVWFIKLAGSNRIALCFFFFFFIIWTSSSERAPEIRTALEKVVPFSPNLCRHTELLVCCVVWDTALKSVWLIGTVEQEYSPIHVIKHLFFLNIFRVFFSSSRNFKIQKLKRYFRAKGKVIKWYKGLGCNRSFIKVKLFPEGNGSHCSTRREWQECWLLNERRMLKLRLGQQEKPVLLIYVRL